jgi:hypothetical protein
LVIENEHYVICEVQPLGDELLLVCPRASWRSADDIDENARVYSRSGQFLRSFVLGDGIRSVQTTAAGTIWTSYFDEGVFGSYGWQKPLGESGLVAWSSVGSRLYEYEPVEGLSPICDCYALNVESTADVWCYYYDEFPLVHIRDYKIWSFWKLRIGGGDTFAVYGKYVLFRSTYKRREIYQLISLEEDSNVNPVLSIEFVDEDGKKFVDPYVCCRGKLIHLLHAGKLYCADVEHILREV